MYYVYNVLYVAKYGIVRVYMALYAICTSVHYMAVALSTPISFLQHDIFYRQQPRQHFIEKTVYGPFYQTSISTETKIFYKYFLE